MRDVSQVVQSIHDLLAVGRIGPSDREVVDEFQRYREQAAARLTAFWEALDDSDEYRALQLAEEDTRLPDFIAHLHLRGGRTVAAFAERHAGRV
jgi:hypothetical protein